MESNFPIRAIIDWAMGNEQVTTTSKKENEELKETIQTLMSENSQLQEKLEQQKAQNSSKKANSYDQQIEKEMRTLNWFVTGTVAAVTVASVIFSTTALQYGAR